MAMSRFYDERHNPSDIWAGALMGLALSNVAYWRRFDRNGRPRRWEPAPSPGTAPKTSFDVVSMPGGLALSGTF
ncbi:Hypothetical protein A7982_03899 [Minicystis rosea]|nr:Hypothetical protein A7982_03899 [Minicystis rosea]